MLLEGYFKHSTETSSLLSTTFREKLMVKSESMLVY